MPFDRFLIAPFNNDSGLQTNLRPWQIPDAAFEEITNAYVFRGRVRKRFGTRLMADGNSVNAPLLSRLRLQVGVTNGAGALAGNVGGAVWKAGQLFSIGNEIFTVVISAGGPQPMLTNGASTTSTFDTATGNFNFVGAAAAAPIFFYPSEPVMGLTVYQLGPINDQPSFAADTQYIYKWSAGWFRVGLLPPTFTGSNSQFFWFYNYEGFAVGDVALFVTNFNPPDGIYWYTATTNTWTRLVPVVIAGITISTCLLIVSFHGRLLLLNTVENGVSYPQRVRFSRLGDATTNATSFLESTQVGSQGAGFLDATTEEQIVTCSFIKDRLIVYFQRSCWELAYTYNEANPFIWQRISSELGSESTFSVVPFDKEIFAIANVGIHACSGANVQRIDEKIPDEIFEISNRNAGVKRVAGVRDFYVECVYWSFPLTGKSPEDVFPDRVLLFNYVNNTWAVNIDTFTAFGYFEQQSDVTWATAEGTWQNYIDTWVSGVLQQQFRQIIAGNQQGFVVKIFPDDTNNAPSMQITNIVIAANVVLTIYDHTLQSDEFIRIDNAQAANITLDRKIYKIIRIDKDNIELVDVLEATGAYIGGATATRASKINILSKRWNPYDKQGSNVFIEKIDFAVQKTGGIDPILGPYGGELTIDYFPSSSEQSILQAAFQTESIMGTGVLETHPYSPEFVPLEQFQSLLWHPVYFQASGDSIQINISLSDDQMIDPVKSEADFELEGMVLHTQRLGLRIY